MKRRHVERARGLRRNMTDAEQAVWYRLRNRALGGYRFRRQHDIGPYIADFVCKEAMLVLEIDADDFTIWSIAVSPRAAGRKLGAALMAFADERARGLGYESVHLYTHASLSQRIGWYERLGFTITHHEEMADRRLTHMRKTFSKAG